MKLITHAMEVNIIYFPEMVAVVASCTSFAIGAVVKHQNKLTANKLMFHHATMQAQVCTLRY